MRVITNNINAATTIEGPDGVSSSAEASNPPTTASTPATAAPAAIFSGLVAKRRDDACCGQYMTQSGMRSV